jgi:diguanylate cyclase (GGDEF)-like protein
MVFNGVISLLIFSVTVLWLSRIKTILGNERRLARTDFTTGAINKRCFCDLINMEIRRFKRYRRTFTVVMIDLDNFKAVNDHMGHHTGDDVLQKVVDTLNFNLRDTDIVARLGGDEFALLMPETDAASARVVISQTQKKLLSVMQWHHFPVTFSIGVLTFKAVPHTAHEVLHQVDDLMYTAKRDGKNTVRYSVFPANIVQPERLAG